MDNQNPNNRKNPLKDPRYRFRLFTGYEPTEPYTKEEYDQSEAESYLGSGIPGNWLDYLVGNESNNVSENNSKTKEIYNSKIKGK